MSTIKHNAVNMVNAAIGKITARNYFNYAVRQCMSNPEPYQLGNDYTLADILATVNCAKILESTMTMETKNSFNFNGEIIEMVKVRSDDDNTVESEEGVWRTLESLEYGERVNVFVGDELKEPFVDCWEGFVIEHISNKFKIATKIDNVYYLLIASKNPKHELSGYGDIFHSTKRTKILPFSKDAGMLDDRLLKALNELPYVKFEQPIDLS
jgi:hypothetical protein